VWFQPVVFDVGADIGTRPRRFGLGRTVRPARCGLFHRAGCRLEACSADTDGRLGKTRVRETSLEQESRLRRRSGHQSNAIN
jgi:hypothetical protein